MEPKIRAFGQSSRHTRWVRQDTRDISFGPERVLKVVFDEVWLARGAGTNQMIFRTNVSAPNWLGNEHGDVVSVLATGKVACGNLGMSAVGPLGTSVWDVRGYDVQHDLVLMMSDEQVLALDHLAGPTGLILFVDVLGTWLGAPPGVISAGCQVQLSLSEAEWRERVDNLGGDVALTLRIPAPLRDPGAVTTAADAATIGSRTQAAARLRKAREALKDGRYEDCVSSCRLVLDSLALLRPLPSAKAVFGKSPRERTPDERWAVLFHDAQSLLSVAHRDDEVTMAATFGRQDAETALALVAGLAARAVSDG